MGSSTGQRLIGRLLRVSAALLVATGALVGSKAPVALAELLPASPVMYIEPHCFDHVGLQQIRVTGRNFVPGTQLIVTEYSHFGTFAGGWTVFATVDNYGNFAVDMTFTTTTTAPNVRLDAVETEAEKTWASAFASGCGQGPFLTVSPTCGVSDNPVIPVHGEGWLDSGSILIELLKDNVRVGNSATVNAQPTFDVNFSPGVTLSPGQYQVHATWSSGEFYEDEYAYFITPCPVATVEPTCSRTAGEPPDRMSIDITGVSGWLQGTADGYDEIQVVFDLYGHPQEFFFSSNPYEGEVGILPDGSFRTLEINPYLRPNGVYTIQIKQQGYGDEPLLQQQVQFTVPCANPVIKTDRTCGPPAIIGDVPKTYTITVTGTGYVPGQKVTLTFDADGVAGPDFPPDSYFLKAGRDGGFTLAIKPAYRPPGTYRIVAYQDVLSTHLENSVTFKVPCRTLAPVLTIDPTCETAAAGQAGAYTLDVAGSGFATGFVELVFDPTGVPVTSNTQADNTGAFNTKFVVDGRPPGTYPVVAHQITAVGLLTEQTQTLLVPCTGQVLRITPASGPRGFVPLVEGFGFPALTTLELEWDQGIGANQPIKVQTDDNGNFSRQVMVFQHDFTGPRNMTVHNPADPTAYTDLVAPYLVVVGTVIPPFVTDNPFGPSDPIVIRR